MRNLSQLLSALIAVTCLVPTVNAANLRDPDLDATGRSCVLQAIEWLPEDPENHPLRTTFECEAADGYSYSLILDEDQYEDLSDMMESGKFIPNSSILHFRPNEGSFLAAANIKISDEDLLFPRGAKISDYIKSPDPTNMETSRAGPPSIGNSATLLVRVTDSKNKVVEAGAEQMSKWVYGPAEDDLINVRSQFSNCSHGLLDFQPDPEGKLGNNAAAPGTIEVKLDIPFDGSSQKELSRATIAAVEAKVGFELPGPYNHVMLAFEDCYKQKKDDCGFTAYAILGGWRSVYRKASYANPAVVMHEIGHNFRLAHSGEGDKPYGDHSCLMGNPRMKGEETGLMCYNAAKNWQIGWYNEPGDKIDFKPITGPSKFWSGTFVGIADYSHEKRAGRPVNIRIDTETKDDIFVHFNRVVGMNAQNKEASDQVAVYKAGENGEDKSKSLRIGELSEGNTFEIKKFGSSKETLTITVTEINLLAEPAYASVEFCLGGCSQSSSASPSESPSESPIGGCTDDSNALFFLKKKSNGKVLTKKCSWLDVAKPKKAEEACKNVKSSKSGIPPARVICPLSCNTCQRGPSTAPSPMPSASLAPSFTGDCLQKGSSEFYKSLKNGKKEIFEDCNWLSRQGSRKRATFCEKKKSSRNGVPPARFVCPVTCDTCSEE